MRILEEHRDDSGHVERVSLLTQTDFGLAVRNWRVPGGKKTEPSNWWLRHRGRREFNSIDFNPGGYKEGEYNLLARSRQYFRVLESAGSFGSSF